MSDATSALTEYLSWRWTLYVNLLFAGVAFTGGAVLLKRQPSPVKPRLDVPGVVLVCSAVFCLVYGFSNAATHNWHTPSTWGFLTAGVVLLAAFALWQGRAAHPLLPPRVVLDRNRGGAYLSFFIGTAGLFGIFLFLTYYLQQTLGYQPTVTVSQMLGGSVGTSLLNTIFAGAVASYFAAHAVSARLIGRQALTGLALAHGYDTAFWWTAGIFACGAVAGGIPLRRGPLGQQRPPSPAPGGVTTAQAGVSQERVQ